MMVDDDPWADNPWAEKFRALVEREAGREAERVRDRLLKAKALATERYMCGAYMRLMARAADQIAAGKPIPQTVGLWERTG